MSIDRSRRTTCEQVADLYNETRPEYPDELAEDIIRHQAALLHAEVKRDG